MVLPRNVSVNRCDGLASLLNVGQTLWCEAGFPLLLIVGQPLLETIIYARAIQRTAGDRGWIWKLRMTKDWGERLDSW